MLLCPAVGPVLEVQDCKAVGLAVPYLLVDAHGVDCLRLYQRVAFGGQTVCIGALTGVLKLSSKTLKKPGNQPVGVICCDDFEN